MESVVNELENVTNHEMAFATRLAEMSNEIQTFVRDKEVKRKKVTPLFEGLSLIFF